MFTDNLFDVLAYSPRKTWMRLSWNHTLLKLFNVIDHWCQICPRLHLELQIHYQKFSCKTQEVECKSDANSIPRTNTTIPEEAGEKLQNSSVRFFPLGCRSTNRFSRFKRKFRNVFDNSGFNFLRI